MNAVLLWSVSAELRPFALSAAEFSQHLLGDIPAPPLLGLLQVWYMWGLPLQAGTCPGCRRGFGGCAAGKHLSSASWAFCWLCTWACHPSSLTGAASLTSLLPLPQSRLGDWRASMSAVTGLLAVAVALFAVALCHAGGAADASARQVLAVEGELLADGQEVGGERDSERGGAAAAVAGQDLTEPLLSAAPA